MRSQVLEHALGAVAVRHEAGDEPAVSCFFEHFDCPLDGDERLVVRGHHDLRAE